MISISAGPPNGFGPDRATALPQVPLRSSRAPANPVTSQPAGTGQGSQTGTAAAAQQLRQAAPGELHRHDY